MMLGKPKYMEEPSADVGIEHSRLSQKVDELTPCLAILCDKNASPEHKEAGLLMMMKLCDEMGHIVSQPIQNAVVFQPDPSD
jgi:hypothetical protein